jgi:hypothetical protein
MKFCPEVPEICRGQVHVPRKERKKERKKEEEEENNNNNKKKRSKNDKSPIVVWET